MEMCHVNFNSCSGGLLISEQCNFIAATPDGMISCDQLLWKCDSCIGNKVPFYKKDDDPDLAQFLENGSLPKGHQYYWGKPYFIASPTIGRQQ